MMHWIVVCQDTIPSEEEEVAVPRALLCQEVAEAALTTDPHCQEVAVAVPSNQVT